MEPVLAYAEFKLLTKIKTQKSFGQHEITTRFASNLALITKGGMCFGISHMAISAFLADDFERFSQRLMMINALPDDFFPDKFNKVWALNASLYQRVKDKQRLLKEEIVGTQAYREAELELLRCKDEFSEVHSFIVDLEAFFSCICLYQNAVR
jgi:hypothetical protein